MPPDPLTSSLLRQVAALAADLGELGRRISSRGPAAASTLGLSRLHITLDDVGREVAAALDLIPAEEDARGHA